MPQLDACSADRVEKERSKSASATNILAGYHDMVKDFWNDPANSALLNKKRDEGKSKRRRAASPFQAHMSLVDARKLKIGDYIDHRDSVGKSHAARIEDKKNSNLLVHYDGWTAKYDVWTDYETEIWRFGAHKSISGRKAHRLRVRSGDSVEVQPTYLSEWLSCTIKKRDRDSGQIKVGENARLRHGMYWVHVDNAMEVRTPSDKSHTQEVASPEGQVEGEARPRKRDYPRRKDRRGEAEPSRSPRRAEVAVTSAQSGEHSRKSSILHRLKKSAERKATKRSNSLGTLTTLHARVEGDPSARFAQRSQSSSAVEMQSDVNGLAAQAISKIVMPPPLTPLEVRTIIDKKSRRGSSASSVASIRSESRGQANAQEITITPAPSYASGKPTTPFKTSSSVAISQLQAIADLQQQVADLTTRLKLSDHRQASLQAQLDTKTTTVENYKRLAGEDQESYSELQVTYQSIQVDVHNLKQENARLQKDLDQARVRNRKLNGTWKKKLREAEGRSSELHDTNNRLRSEVETMRIQAVTMTNQNKNLPQLISENVRLKSELKSRSIEQQQGKHEIERLQKFKEQKQRYEAELRVLKEEKNRLERKGKILLRKTEEEMKKNKSLETLLDANEREAEQVKQRLTKLEAQVHELEISNTEKDHNISKLQKDIRRLQREAEHNQNSSTTHSASITVTATTTTTKTSAQAEKTSERISLACDNGHGLVFKTSRDLTREHSDYTEGYVCSMCSMIFMKRASYHCSQCFYDICPSCAAKTEVAARRPRAEGEIESTIPKTGPAKRMPKPTLSRKNSDELLGGDEDFVNRKMFEWRKSKEWQQMKMNNDQLEKKLLRREAENSQLRQQMKRLRDDYSVLVRKFLELQAADMTKEKLFRGHIQKLFQEKAEVKAQLKTVKRRLREKLLGTNRQTLDTVDQLLSRQSSAPDRLVGNSSLSSQKAEMMGLGLDPHGRGLIDIEISKALADEIEAELKTMNMETAELDTFTGKYRQQQQEFQQELMERHRELSKMTFASGIPAEKHPVWSSQGLTKGRTAPGATVALGAKPLKPVKSRIELQKGISSSEGQSAFADSTLPNVMTIDLTAMPSLERSVSAPAVMLSNQPLANISEHVPLHRATTETFSTQQRRQSSPTTRRTLITPLVRRASTFNSVGSTVVVNDNKTPSPISRRGRIVERRKYAQSMSPPRSPHAITKGPHKIRTRSESPHQKSSLHKRSLSLNDVFHVGHTKYGQRHVASNHRRSSLPKRSVGSSRTNATSKIDISDLVGRTRKNSARTAAILRKTYHLDSESEAEQPMYYRKKVSRKPSFKRSQSYSRA